MLGSAWGLGQPRVEEERWVEVGQGRGRNGAWVDESGGREKKMKGRG